MKLRYSGLDSKEVEDYAMRFYGFGNLTSCEYLFIGPEFGGSFSTFDLKARINAWRELGSKSTVDAPEFHDLIEEPRWFREIEITGQRKKVYIQRTYGALIRTLPDVKRSKPADTTEAVRNFQKDKFGRKSEGKNYCFIEVSALNRRGQGDPSVLEEMLGADMMSKISEDRKKFIIDSIRKNKKLRTIVIYGAETLDDLGSGFANRAKARKVEVAESHVFESSLNSVKPKVTVLWTAHPNARNLGGTNNYFEGVGRRFK